MSRCVAQRLVLQNVARGNLELKGNWWLFREPILHVVHAESRVHLTAAAS